MIEVRLREGEGFADVAGMALAQGVIPSLHMIGFSARLADTAVGLGWKDFAGALPQITQAATAFVGWGDAPPQAPPRPRPMIPQDKSHDLARTPPQRGPHPALRGLLPYKTPHFIDLQLIPCPG